MKIYFILFFVLILLILTISYPLNFKVNIHFNLFKNVGFYSVNFALITLLCGKLKIAKDGKLEIENKVDKLSKSSSTSDALVIKILQKIYVRDVVFYMQCGKKNDAYFTAILSGGVRAFIQSVYGFLNVHYAGINTMFKIQETTKKDEIIVTTSVQITVTIFDYLIAWLQAKVFVKEN